MFRSSRFLPAALAVAALVAPTAALAAPGDLDSSFGTGGVFKGQLSATDTLGSWADDILALSDGRLLTAGMSTAPNGHTTLTVARQLDSGALDATFGTGGIARADAGTTPNAFAGANALAVDASGRVIAAGDAGREHMEPHDGGIDEWAALAVFTPGGQLDTSFNGTGVATAASAGYTRAWFNDVLVQPDGKIVAAGFTYNASNQGVALVARYLPTGAPDTSFAGTGVLRRQFGTGASPTSRVTGIVQQPDGKLVLVGDTSTDVLVARLTAGGAPDPSFGTGGDGAVRIPLGENGVAFATGDAVALTPDGRIVVAASPGYVITNGEYLTKVAAVRLNSHGALDASFGTGGVVRTQFGQGAEPRSGAYGIALQADGSVVLAGYATDAGMQGAAALVRYTAGGALDTSFGSGGSVAKQFGFGVTPTSTFESVIVDPAGRIVAAGLAGDQSNINIPDLWTVARFVAAPAPTPVPAATPTPTPTPAAPHLVLPATARTDRHGVAHVMIRCAAWSGCTGTLTLYRTVVRQHPKRRVLVRIGHAAIAIPSGARRTILVRLTPSARRLVHSHHHLKVTATARLQRPGATAVVIRRTVLLR